MGKEGGESADWDGQGPEQVGEDMLRSDEELGPKLEWAKLIRMAS